MCRLHNYCWRHTHRCLHNYWLLLIIATYVYITLIPTHIQSKNGRPRLFDGLVTTVKWTLRRRFAGVSSMLLQWKAKIAYDTPIPRLQFLTMKYPFIYPKFSLFCFFSFETKVVEHIIDDKTLI